MYITQIWKIIKLVLVYILLLSRISLVEMSAECSIDIDTVYDLWLAEQQASYFGIEPGGEEL